MIKLSLLRIYPKLPPLSGGMEQHISLLSQFQETFFRNITVIFSLGEAVPFLKSNNVRIQSNLFKLTNGFIAFFYFYVLVLFYISKKSIQSNILHIHGDWSSFVFSSFIKSRIGANLVVCSLHADISGRSYIKNFLLQKSLQSADIIFSTAHSNISTLKTWFPLKNIQFQPSGIQQVFFQTSKIIKNNTFTCITVANLSKVKNHAMILNLASELVHIHFVFVGAGPLLDEITHAVQEKGLTNVQILGYKSKEEVAELLASSHVYLTTSKEEGTSTSILEAMALGLPIISSAAGGTNAIITQEENGFVFESYDLDVYKQAILRLHSDASLYKSISENNIEKSKQFHWDHVTKNITDHMIAAYQIKLKPDVQ